MALWLTRAGRNGERESLALTNNLVVIGWDDLPNLSKIKSRSELAALLAKIYSEEKPKKLQNWESQIWPFINGMNKGDLVALPLKTRSAVAIGEILGAYEYRSDLPHGPFHTRPVKWIKELPRSAFDQDLLYSLGAFMTVCRIKRNQAEERVKALLSGKRISLLSNDNTEIESESSTDLTLFAKDQIRTFINQKFKGHKLTNLIAGILSTQGYHLYESPEGPDGGIDIIAGKGTLGFDQPRIVVQVKSQDTAIDVKVLRELQGVIKNFGAEQGLLVAWGGYNKAVAKEAVRTFFEIRIWDADDVVNMIQEVYDKLPEEIKADLPLKRIWTLVPEEE